MSEKRKDTKGRILKDGESQRPDGRYMYRYNDIHGNRKCVYAPTLNELRDKEQKIRRDLEDGIDTAAGEMTLGELLDLQLSQKMGLRKSTFHEYKFECDVIKKYSISGMQIKKIKKTDIVSFVLELSGEEYAFGTISNMLAQIKGAMSLAVDNDYIRKNPCHIRLSEIIRNDTQERTPISDDDFNSLIDFMRGHTCFRKYVDLMIILVSTGLRVSELCGLTVDDIDFEKRTILVAKQLKYYGRDSFSLSPPKTAKGIRTIPIEDDRLLAILKQAVKKARSRNIQCTVNGSAPLLFCTTHHTPYRASLLDSQFERIMAAYQKIHPDFKVRVSPHVLRHTFCTTLINNEANIKSVQYLMGHSDISTTLNVYTHADSESIRSAIKRFTPKGSDTKTDTKIDTKRE